MTEPETNEPSEKPKEESEAPPSTGMGPESSRPDWLVGAEDGLDAERAHREMDARPTAEPPRLRRLDDLAPGASARPTPPPPRPAPKPDAPSGPQPNTSSLSSFGAAPISDFLMENKWQRPEPDEAPSPTVREAPQWEKPEPHEGPGTKFREAPMWTRDEESRPFVPRPPSPPFQSQPTIRYDAVADVEARTSSKALSQEIDWATLQRKVITLATDRRVQVVAMVVGAVVGFFLVRAWMEPGLEFSRIRQHPEQFDGQVVTVRGRVGEVFPVGGSYAFNLLHGRDTLVVFTRYRIPIARQIVTVKGSISTGYLEGMPRAALYEQQVQ